MSSGTLSVPVKVQYTVADSLIDRYFIYPKERYILWQHTNKPLCTNNSAIIIIIAAGCPEIAGQIGQCLVKSVLCVDNSLVGTLILFFKD